MGNNNRITRKMAIPSGAYLTDDNSNEVLLRAKQSAQKGGLPSGLFNPSFELWFLLHFVNQQTEVEDCQALIRLLKQPKRIP